MGRGLKASPLNKGDNMKYNKIVKEYKEKNMKKKYLKGWVQVVVEFVALMSFFLLGFDCKDTNTFILGHLIILEVFILATVVLVKYGRYSD